MTTYFSVGPLLATRRRASARALEKFGCTNWRVMGQRHLSLAAGIMAGENMTVATVKMLLLNAVIIMI